jgi:hypothetical protein
VAGAVGGQLPIPEKTLDRITEDIRRRLHIDHVNLGSPA